MGATQPQHSADDAGIEVPTEGFPEGDPMLDVPDQDEQGQDEQGRDEPDQGQAANPESGLDGVPPVDNPDLSGENRFDAG